MTQTNINPRPLGPPSPGPLTFHVFIALIASIAAAPITYGMIWLTQNPWLALMTLLVILGAGNAAWATSFVQNNWRRAHWLLWLAWLFNAWLFLGCAVVIALLWMESHAIFIDPAHLILTVCAGIPAVSLLGALALRGLRSEVALVVTLPPPALLSIIGLGLSFYYEAHPNFNENHIGTLIGILITIIGVTQALPLFVAFAFLRKQHRWGTRPVKTTTCLRCEYDLTGSVTATQSACPECGTTTPPAQQAWITKTEISDTPSPNP